MKQYLLSIYQPDGEAPPPDVLRKIMRDVSDLVEEIRAAGALVFNGGLCPPGSATVVRVRQGRVLVTDGPYVETKEHIGGFLIVRAPDLESAHRWAAKTAHVLTVAEEGGVRSGLAIEVRAFQEETES